MQPVQRIPIMRFPRARALGILLPCRQIQQRQHYIIDFVTVVVHNRSPGYFTRPNLSKGQYTKTALP